MSLRKQITDSINKISQVILKNHSANTNNNNFDYLDSILVRVNVAYSNFWLMKYQIHTNPNIKFYQKYYLQYMLKRQIYSLNKSEFMYLFTDEKNKQIIDELNRNFRVIFFNLDDYFLKGNFMQRDLDQIIEEDILCEKYTNHNLDLLPKIKAYLQENTQNSSEFLSTKEKVEYFSQLIIKH